MSEQPPAWFLDEMAHAGPEHLDPEYVTWYDAKSGTNPDEDLLPLRELGLDETATLVDLGAGTGTLALAAAPFCRRVVAVDVSVPMLARLEQAAAGLGLTNLDIVRAGFLTYQHTGPAADFVYSRNALHHLPDFWKSVALARIAAFLRPGGVLRLRDLVYDFDPAEAADVFETWFANAVADPAHGWTAAEYETHIREEYSTYSWLLEPMLERAGFTIQDVAHAGSRTYSVYTCVKSAA
jgi:SAM-dependent methyltransferase